MDKVKEKLLHDFMKCNKVRREAVARKYGYTAEEYKNYLKGADAASPEPPLTATDIVIAFDTTGSMSSYINDVKNHIVEMVSRLFENTENLRLGIVAFGDYCDMSDATVFGDAYQVLPLSSNEQDIIKFVKGAKNTGGGDANEFYELVIKKIVEETNWRRGSNKSVLLIADCKPHNVGYSYRGIISNNQIDWKKEAKKAVENGIKFDTLSIRGFKWYKELSEITGGVHMLFSSANKTGQLMETYTYARSGSKESFIKMSLKAEKAGDTELMGAYKTLSTL